uniref:Glutamine amidotransferase type-2 domain-containing protein n=1 Tax=Megaviridae environmental sample TaxID=1737588 RepID=A0A5J6VKK9_9VIRU|nr:MAG: hypothetical protein [Megaviridae environmental sample]
MCRLFAYFGNVEKNLYELLVDEKHSIIKQTWRKPYDSNNPRDHAINYDGYGVCAWIDDKVFLYKTPQPPTHDENLQVLKFITSCRIMAHIRAVKPLTESPIHYYNCHPFIANIGNIANISDFDDIDDIDDINNTYAWMHNGNIENFHTCKYELLNYMSEYAFRCIKGNTDSEFMFGLFLSNLELGMLGALLRSIEIMKNVCKGVCSCNIICSDGYTTIITRYINTLEEPPSLYYCEEQDALYVASEPINDNIWLQLPKNEYYVWSKN